MVNSRLFRMNCKIHTTAIRALGDEKAPFLNNSIVRSNSINALGDIVALGHHFTVDPNTT